MKKYNNEENKNNLNKEDKKIEENKIKNNDIKPDIYKDNNINYNSLFNKKTKFQKYNIIIFLFLVNYYIYLI